MNGKRATQPLAPMPFFYDMNNIVTIRVTMPAAQWEALKTEQPAGGVCNFDNPPSVDRFQWRDTTSVKISGTSFLPNGKTFNGGEIKKKSFCGSFTDGTGDKPALKLKLPSSAEDIIGARHIRSRRR